MVSHTLNVRVYEGNETLPQVAAVVMVFETLLEVDSKIQMFGIWVLKLKGALLAAVCCVMAGQLDALLTIACGELLAVYCTGTPDKIFPYNPSV